MSFTTLLRSSTTEVTTISTTTTASSSIPSARTMSDAETTTNFTETLNGERNSRYYILLLTTYHTAENFCWKQISLNPPTLALQKYFTGNFFIHALKINIGSIICHH